MTFGSEKPFRYRLYEFVLLSGIALPELYGTEVSEDAPFDVALKVKRTFRSVERNESWHTFPPGSPSPSFLWSRGESGLSLVFPGVAEVVVDARGTEIECVPEPDVPPELLRHILLDAVLPLVLGLRGRQTLHATCVLTPFGACAFSGPSGSGKSTLAAAFLRAGAPVVADDCLLLLKRNGRFEVSAGYPSVRLWDDSADAVLRKERIAEGEHHSTKRRFSGKLARGGPFPLACVYSLSTGERGSSLAKPRLHTLSHRAAFLILTSSASYLELIDRAALKRQFHFISALAGHVPVKMLEAPRSYESLPSVRDAILRDLALLGCRGRS